MFWNNQEKERKKEKIYIEEKKKNLYACVCVRSLNGENDCPFYLTPCVRETEKKATSIKYNHVLVMYFHSFSWYIGSF
jgi:hypothetical protein